MIRLLAGWLAATVAMTGGGAAVWCLWWAAWGQINAWTWPVIVLGATAAAGAAPIARGLL